MANTLRIIGLRISQVCLVLLLAAFILELETPVSGQRGLIKVEQFDSPFIYRFGQTHGFHNGQAFEKLGEFATRGSHHLDKARSPTTIRILSYGDSIGNGMLVSADQAYSGRLEALLNQGRPGRYEVINMMRGSSPGIYSYHLRHDVPILNPDMVIMEIELLNDLGDEGILDYSSLDGEGLPSTLIGARYLVGLNNQSMAAAPYLSFLGANMQQTALVSLIQEHIGSLAEYIHPNEIFAPSQGEYYHNIGFDRPLLTRSRLKFAFNRMFNTLQAIQTYLERRHIQFLLVILPSSHAFDAKSPNHAQALRLVDRAIKRSEQLHIHWVSPVVELGKAGGADIYFDYCHPKAIGHDTIAKVILSKIREHMPTESAP